MLEKLEQVDTSSLSEFRSLRKRRTIIEKRIELMEKKSDSVSMKVLERVREDYNRQLQELDVSAKPLMQQVGAEYRKLVRFMADLNATLEEIKLDKEEVALRRELGEFNEKVFKEKIAECSLRVEHCESVLGEASQLQEQFIECVRSEDELLNQEGENDQPDARDTPTEEEASPEFGMDRPIQQLQEAQSEKTRLVTLPRLVRISPDETPESFNLRIPVTLVGRDRSNHICLEDETISRNHARIELDQEGFVIYDRGSENGVFVNGSRVEKHLLEDGDRVSFGSNGSEFVFRQA